MQVHDGTSGAPRLATVRNAIIDWREMPLLTDLPLMRAIFFQPGRDWLGEGPGEGIQNQEFCIETHEICIETHEILH